MPQPTSATAAPTSSLAVHAIERRQPLLQDVRHVARPQHGADRAEQAARVLAPFDAAARQERLFDLRLRGIDCANGFDCAADVDVTVLLGEGHRLLGRKLESLPGRLIGQVAGGRILREPFARVAFRNPGFFCKRRACDRPDAVHCLVKAEPHAGSHERHADRGADIADHLHHELSEFVRIGHGVISLLRFCCAVPPLEGGDPCSLRDEARKSKHAFLRTRASSFALRES